MIVSHYIFRDDGNQILFLLLFCLLFLIAYILVGEKKIILNIFDGKEPGISHFFSRRLKSRPEFIFATYRYDFITLIGLFLLVFPGIIWGIKYRYYSELIFDKGMDSKESFKWSAIITNGVKWELFQFKVLLLLIRLFGLLVFGIGFFVANSITIVADVYVYRKLLGQVEEYDLSLTVFP